MLRLFLILLSVLVLCPLSLSAQPITTKYYSLNLPPDWVVLKGPERGQDSVILQLSDSARTVTATLMVGSVRPGEAERAREHYAKSLKAKAMVREGQTEFSISHGQERGCYIMREDKKHQLMLLLSLSGKMERADFLFRMRSPYPALVPRKPLSALGKN